MSARFHGVPPFVLLGGRGVQGSFCDRLGCALGPSAEGPEVLKSVLLRSGAANSCSAEAAGVLIKVLLDALGL